MAKKALRTLRQAQGPYPELGRRIRKGFFITFEGPEGCGKSTQSRLLYRYLRKSYDCVYTREPGGTKLGERLRRIILSADGTGISDLSELFLFETCRCQIVSEIVKPALFKNRLVVCDRFSDATFSYQGFGSGLPFDVIRALDRVATGGLKPDLTILLDIDEKRGLKRAMKKGADRMERKQLAFHRRVRLGYLELARRESDRIKVVRVDGNIDKIQEAVRREVERAIQRYKRQ